MRPREALERRGQKTGWVTFAGRVCEGEDAVPPAPKRFIGASLMKPGWIGLVLLMAALSVQAVQRFPRPDFKTDHVVPEMTVPAPRGTLLAWLDVAVLVAALGLAGRFALRNRSRRRLLWLTGFSLAYFGFWRRGCVCSVGSLQNVASGLADPAVVLPVTVLAFFAIPLLGALFHGRTFCASVCPLGAVQELVLWRPVRVPGGLHQALSLVPWIVLCTAVLWAATGAGFLVCRWDPFVGLFRLGAPLQMVLLGAGVIVLSLFVGRPYCRYFCPYGPLLGLMARVARRHVAITPSECIQCRLCENACPYGAIRKPVPDRPPESRAAGARRLMVILALTPGIVLAAAATGMVAGNMLSRAHPRVALALDLWQNADPSPETMTPEREAFWVSGTPTETVFADQDAIQRRFAGVGAVLGAVLALIVCARLFNLSIWRSRTDYEPDRAQCVSCGRCFAYCPVGQNHYRTGGIAGKTMDGGA